MDKYGQNEQRIPEYIGHVIPVGIEYLIPKHNQHNIRHNDIKDLTINGLFWSNGNWMLNVTGISNDSLLTLSGRRPVIH